MKKILFIPCVVIAISFMASCGSSWEISGNQIEIHKCQTDTVVPAGTIIMTDSSNSLNVR